MQHSMQDIHSHLNVLGLDGIPDEETLRARYKRLLIRYHPDRNTHRRSWAHERTLEIIAAQRFIKKYIPRSQSGVQEKRKRTENSGRVRPDQSKYTDQTTDQKTHTEKKRPPPGPPPPRQAHRPGEKSFQLIEAQEGSYALPVESIVAVIAARGALEENAFGFFTCYGGIVYPVQTLHNGPLETEKAEFLILFSSGENRTGILVNRGTKFTGIEQFSSRESAFVDSRQARERGWLFNKGKFYLYPERLHPASERIF